VFGANLLVRSLLEVRGVDPGFRPDHVLVANLSMDSVPGGRAFYDQVLQGVQALPGVRSVGLVENLLISGAPNAPISVEGQVGRDRGSQPLRIDAVAGDFFPAMRVPLRAGRTFDRGDAADTRPVAVINEEMARRYWPGETAIGRRFRVGGPASSAPWIEVVGVVGDMRRQGPEAAPIPQAFRPYAQLPQRNMNLVVRTDEPGLGLANAIRARIADVDRTVPLYGVTTLQEAYGRYSSQRRFQTSLLGLFSVVALALAAVGIYGLIQYSVSQRRRELGVRLALGATSRGLEWMVVREGLAVALPGLAAGVIGAVLLSRVIASLLFGVTATDPWNVVVTMGVLLVVAVAASYLPARRAGGVDPVAALRHE
jgi:putative ABC transport system permease protein